MLVQAACAARLGYLSYKNPFIVVALYIENSGRVTRYFLFQLDGADHTVGMFYLSNPAPSHWFLLGFLRLGRPTLDAGVHVVYCNIRNLKPRVDNTK